MIFYCVVAIHLIKNGFYIIRLGTVEAKELPPKEVIKRPPYKEITKIYFHNLRAAKKYCKKHYKPVTKPKGSLSNE